jgi:hypothetical protein
VAEQSGPPVTGASLARRLRELRRSHFPDAKITQLQLAQALSKDEAVADSTLSSWENVKAPTLPPQSRLSGPGTSWSGSSSSSGPRTLAGLRRAAGSGGSMTMHRLPSSALTSGKATSWSSAR